MPKPLLIVVLALMPLFLFGQVANSLSDHIGSADGLSSQLCKIILEDDLGNIWIGHEKTFNKYDGYNVTEYNALNAFGDEKFADLLALDHKGSVWMIRSEQGDDHFRSKHFLQVDWDYSAHLINPLTNELLSFEEAFPNSPFKLSTVVQIFVRDRSIFFYTTEQELYKYDDNFKLILKEIDKEKFLGVENDTYFFEWNDIHTIIRKSFKDEKEEVHDTQGLTKVPFYYFEQDGGLVISSFEIGKEEVYILKHGKLYTFQKELKEKALKDGFPIFFLEIKFDHENDLISKSGHLNLEEWGVSPEEIKVIDRRFCNDFFVSKTGLLYVATGLGVYIFNPNKPIISSFKDVSSKVYSTRKMIIDDDIIIRVKDDKELIESKSQKYNTDFIDESLKSVSMIEHYQDPINPAVVYSTGWSFGHDVRKIDFENEEAFLINAQKTGNPSFGIFRSSITGFLYLYGKGFAIYNEVEQQFEKSKLFNRKSKYGIEFSDKTDYQINYVTEHDSKLWICTHSGIVVYDEINEKFIDYEFQKFFSNTKIQYLHFDKYDNDILWVGTSNKGLKRLNLKTKDIKSWDDTNGFSNNSIHFIYQDEKNRLWISTNNLLNCLDLETERNYIFSEKDGIAHPEFNTYSYYKNEKTGHLYLGGLGGISYFQPDSIDFNKQSAISVNLISVNKIDDKGQPVDCKLNSILKEGLTMEDNHVSIDIELGTNFHFNNDEKVFSYKIPPYLNEWRDLKSNDINIPRLPYGSYKLHFISDVQSPTKTSGELIVDISIVRPFHKTWLCYILCFIGFVGLSVLYQRVRTQNIIKRNIELEALVEKRTNQLEQANSSKTRIFQILAHDLRSPIASLIGLSKMVAFLSSKDRLEDLEIVAQQTEKKVNALNENLDNLLQWAIIEKGNITNKPIKVNVFDEFSLLLELYKSSIEVKKIKLKNEINESDEAIVDITIFQTISRNALDNAIKFCKVNGEIILSFKKEYGQAKVMVRNEYDVSINEEMKGTGLGFQISQELANLSDGTVNLELNKNGYSEFVFQFKN